MPKRALALLAVGAAIAVVAAVVLIGGGDGGAGEILHGRPGFPLRGSLAHDDKPIETAVAEWRKQSAEDAKDPDADHALQGPDADDTVTVLWAGHIREDDVVVAEAADEVAELSHQGSLGWSVDGVTARDRLEASDVPVGAGGAIVLPDSGQWRYVDAAVLSGGMSRADGLLFGYDSSPEGFVVPTTDDVDPAVYIAGVGGRRVSRPDLAALRGALAAGGARALWRAADAGQTALDDAARRDGQSFGHAGDAQTLNVVWTGRLPGRRHGAVVSEGRGPGMSLALGFGEVPKTANSAGKEDEGSELLGFGSSRLGRRAGAGEAVGGAYIQLGEEPYLAVAGTGVKEITAIVGRHTISHSAPFALIPATPLEPKGGTATDTVVYGHDKYGAVVAPLPSSY
jgi:hypothetical protein